ncbi:MAG: hypothetical protein LBU85_11990 [Treponema sp.]|jgi:hypothetical protein|nr:hypothetical protein [Treponema sp.]
MVNKRFLMGILALALVFGMTVVGCDNGSTGGGDESSDLDGTWISTTMVDGRFKKIVNSGGNFTLSIAASTTATSWKEVVKGTYPKNAKSPVTVTITQASMYWIDGTDVWKKWEEIILLDPSFLGGSQTQTITISNNQITANGEIFQKQ